MWSRIILGFVLLCSVHSEAPTQAMLVHGAAGDGDKPNPRAEAHARRSRAQGETLRRMSDPEVTEALQGFAGPWAGSIVRSATHVNKTYA